MTAKGAARSHISIKRFAGSRRAAWLVVLLLIAAANGWAVGYVSAERYVYAWDWASYWLMFQDLGALLRGDPASALAAIGQSVAASESNVLPVLPLMPFALVFGPGRLSYILAIVNAGVLPGAMLMALVVERMMPRRSWPRCLLGAASILGLHVLWAPALRGLPDVVGVGIASAIVLVFVATPLPRHRVTTLAGIGVLLCLLVLTRRYYLFWAAGFFPAALLGWLLATPKGERDRRMVLAAIGNLAIIGTVCAACVLILAAPVVGHIATTDYGVAYAAYRSDLVGAGTAGQVVDHVGIALLVVCSGGLGWLAVRPQTRSLGILLIVQAGIAFVLFTRVQTLFGVHHFYLFVPAAGIGLAAAIAGLWDGASRASWRIAGSGAVLAVVLASSAAVFSPMPLALGPLFPRVRYPPLVRSDLAEVDRLLATLTAFKPSRVYVVASAQTFNWSILAMACRDRRPLSCPSIAVTQEIDTRDGFPRGILDADYVVLATPTQYHVRPQDQRVVGLVARDIRAGSGIGAAFRRLPGSFRLEGGIRVDIYRRIALLPPPAVRAIGDELGRVYPGMRHFFAAPVTGPVTAH